MAKRHKPNAASVASAVNPEMLARYREAAHAPTLTEDNRLLMSLVDDYEALVASGDAMLALGAGLEIVDLGLRIAARPAASHMERRYKAGFLGHHFPSMTGSFGHGHVGRLALAALAAEGIKPAGPEPVFG